MAAFYADENFPLQTVEALRRVGHDVLTAIEAGQASQRIADDLVLAFAARVGRAVLTLNRREFIALHTRNRGHAGIVVCRRDSDVERQSAAIDAAVSASPSMPGVLIQANRPG